MNGKDVFENFRTHYRPDGDGAAGAPLRPPATLVVGGFASFADAFSGVSFNGGVYRVHDEASRPISDELVSRAFPSFAGRIYCFAYDWLGRQFSLDADRQSHADPQIHMFEPGTGQALEIPVRLVDFHEVELVDFADACLASTFFDAWMATEGASRRISRSTCVGYKVPLFLDGEDTLDNLEPVDLELYWHLCGELLQGTRYLPRGTTISNLTID